MKKVLALLIVFVFTVFCVCGCSSDSKKSTSKAETASITVDTGDGEETYNYKTDKNGEITELTDGDGNIVGSADNGDKIKYNKDKKSFTITDSDGFIMVVGEKSEATSSATSSTQSSVSSNSIKDTTSDKGDTGETVDGATDNYLGFYDADEQ